VEECNAALAELEATLPTLILSVVDQRGHDISDATLSIDGQSVALDGSALAVDPGLHTVVAEHDRRRTQIQIVASEKELNRHVELMLADPPMQPKKNRRPEQPPASSRLPSFALAGVSALGAGSFAIFALSGDAQVNDLERCKPHCSTADVNSVRTKYLIADVSLGVSLAALGAATYLLLTHKAPKPSDAAAVTFDIEAAPGTAGLAMRWTE
jgi:hypothetical protein